MKKFGYRKGDAYRDRERIVWMSARTYDNYDDFYIGDIDNVNLLIADLVRLRDEMIAEKSHETST